jgi:hypothetical protein
LPTGKRPFPSRKSFAKAENVNLIPILERLYQDEYGQEVYRAPRCILAMVVKPDDVEGSHRFRKAGPIATRFLNRMGFAAVVSPWRTIYMLEKYFDHTTLRRHELAHIAQINRDGAFKFWIKCVAMYYYCGYTRSPIEIEARRAETDPHHPLFRYLA